MKNLLIFIISLSLSLNASAAKNPAHQIHDIIIKALTHEQLDKVFDREECEEIYPLVFVTNDLIDTQTAQLISSNFQEIVNRKTSIKSKNSTQILSLDSVSVGLKKSILDFSYNGKRLKIRLKKVDEEWKVYSVKVSGNSTFSFYFDA